MYLGIPWCPNSLAAPVAFVKFAHIFRQGNQRSAEQVIRSALLVRTYWVKLKKIEIPLCSLS